MNTQSTYNPVNFTLAETDAGDVLGMGPPSAPGAELLSATRIKVTAQYARACTRRGYPSGWVEIVIEEEWTAANGTVTKHTWVSGECYPPGQASDMLARLRGTAQT
ncbi:MAG: hypothetical protein IPK87_00660 [Planctomycetes bacterium]|nr:hypothetical protein [Planctomycetota bacterium]